MRRTKLHVVGYLIYFMLIMLMSACSSNVISIDAEDSTTFTTLETSIPVTRDDSVRIKLRASRANGDYTQTVPDGQRIVIDNIDIQGPTDVSGTTDLTYGSIGIGGDDIFDGGEALQSKLRTSMYFGLAQTIMDMTLVHEGTTYRTSDRTTELYMQYGISYGITTSFHAGATYAMSIGPDLTGITEGDLKLDYALFKHLQIMAGYRWFDYRYFVEEEDSAVKVKFRGPFVGLYIPF